MEDKLIDIPGIGPVSFPGSMSDQEISAAAKRLYEQSGGGKPLTAGEVATGAVVNFPSSFKNLVGNIVEAVTNPLQTAKSVLDVGAGALQNVLPEKLVQAVGEDKQSRDMARKVGEFYAERYGTGEGLKKAIANDPAGVLADLSTVLSGGATVAPRAVAAPLQAAARTVEPLSMAVRGTAKAAEITGKGISSALGLTTGAGREAISQAYQAGRTGGPAAEAFRQNITGQANISDVLDIAKANLDEMNRLKQTEYRSGMVNIKNDKSVLDFADIDKALQTATNKVTYKGKVVNEGAAQKLGEARQIIDEWKTYNPADFHTPEGLDALKKRVGDVLEAIPFEQKTARGSVGEVYNAIRSTIQKQAPSYANVMKDYTVASEQIREIEKALSLGKGASVDTAIRKLQSLMRNNVQTNYGQRVKLAKQLEEAGGGQMMPALAGQALSELTPRGLQRATALPSGGLAYLVGGPTAAATSLLASSPRLMGETAYRTGQIARGIGATEPFIVNPQLYNLLYQSGQVQGLLGE